MFVGFKIIIGIYMNIQKLIHSSKKFLILIIPFILGSTNFQNNLNEKENFTLSNNSIFSPHSQVSINLYGNIKNRYFQFRLIRIDNPIEFYKNYLSIENSFNNFDIFQKDDGHLLKNTKLIKQWDKILSKQNYNWINSQIDIGVIDESGYYIVQAIGGNQVAYCPIVVSNYSIVYKYDNENILAFTANNQTSEFIKNIDYEIYQNGKLTNQIKSDSSGIILAKADTSKFNFSQNEFSEGTFGNRNSLMLFAKIKDEILISNPFFFYPDKYQNRLIGYVYTNQPVYRPNQEVFFKGIIRQKNGNEILNIDKAEFNVSIKSPRNKEVFSQKLFTNEFGSLWSSFKLDEDAEIGNYSIQIKRDNEIIYGNFSVEEYKKPEFKVTVETSKNHFGKIDTIKGKVKANYYFGSPVSNGNVVLKIYRRNFWIPFFYKSNFRNSQQRIPKIFPYYNQPELVKTIEGKSDIDGSYIFQYEINEKENIDNPDFRQTDFIYELVAEVTDNSKRTINGSESVIVSQGDFNLSATTDKYFVKPNETINITVNAIDFENKGVETSIELIINKIINSQNNSYEKTILELNAKTDSLGKYIFSFTPNEVGNYKFIVSSFDKNKNEIITTGYFYVVDEKYRYWSRAAGIEIVTDKDSYQKGDTLNAIITVPQKNIDALLTYETDKIIDFNKIHINDNTFLVNKILDDKFISSFNISIAFVKEGNFYNHNERIEVLNNDKIITIDIQPSKNIFKPRETAHYKIIAQDNSGNPLKNTELSIGVIDESIYAIKEDNLPSINDFFFAPNYFYIPTYSSLTNLYFNGRSRYATLFDNNYFSTKEISKVKYGSISGKLEIENQNFSYNNIRLILSSDKEIYTIALDSLGKFSDSKIISAQYDVGILSINGNFQFIQTIEVKDNRKNEFSFKIKLEDFYVNEILNFAPTPLQTRSSQSIDVQGERMYKDQSRATKEVYVQPDVRENFVDALYWNPSIITDENGIAEIEFPFSDNLTEWRATVKGVSIDSKFGESKNNVITRKNLLVRLETPRFFREDDKLNITTIVHNYLSSEKKVRVSLQTNKINLIGVNKNSLKNFEGLKKINDNSYEFYIKPNADVSIDWEVFVSSANGEAELYTEALTDEESDAMKIKIPILPNGIKQIQPLNAQLNSNDNTKEIKFYIPENINLSTNELSFTVSPTISTTLLKSIDELVAYPYGCVEQTMSRFLPAVIVANTFNELKITLQTETMEKLPDVINKGLKRLYSFQHSDGGWGWWKNDNTHPYMTAYVIYGLSIAKKSGYEIDENIFSNGIKNLTEQIKNYTNNSSVQKDDLTTYAFMLYALNSANEDEFYNSIDYEKEFERLFESEINNYSLSLLGLIAAEHNDKEKIETIKYKLMKSIKENSTFAYFENNEEKYFWQNDDVQALSYALKFLIRTNADSELLNKIVNWLLTQQYGFSWNSTQQTATVIFALTDYLKFTNELNPDLNVQVYLNGNEIYSQIYNVKNVFEKNEKIKINVINDAQNYQHLKKGENIISIKMNGTGKIYFSGINQFYTKENINGTSNYFTITKSIYKLIPRTTEDGIIYLKEEIKEPIKSGEEIFVKLIIEPKIKNSQFVIVEDYFPSGFEIIKNDEYYTIDGEEQYRKDYWWYRPWRWNYADKEIRDEKISFFVTHFSDKMEFTYLMKAQLSGNYTIFPTEVSLMYYPQIYGNSGESNKIVVK